MKEQPVPHYSTIQPDRIIGYWYRGIYIYGSGPSHFRTHTPRGRGRTDKLPLKKTLKVIDIHLCEGATADQDGLMTNLDFVDYRRRA